MDWNLIAWFMGVGLLSCMWFWIGLAVGYRVKLRRASRLEWPERDRSHLWAEELRHRGIEISPAPLTRPDPPMPAVAPTFRRVTPAPPLRPDHDLLWRIP